MWQPFKDYVFADIGVKKLKLYRFVYRLRDETWDEEYLVCNFVVGEGFLNLFIIVVQFESQFFTYFLITFFFFSCTFSTYYSLSVGLACISFYYCNYNS